MTLFSESETDDQAAANILNTEAMDASWALQRIRGEIARALGFRAVECQDESGTSVLVLDGHTSRK